MCLEENYPDRIADSFTDRTVLISGVTGFLGKVLLEKLLRCAHRNVKKIFVMIRPKNGRSAAERYRKILESPIFKDSNDWGKVQVIECDLSEPLENVGNLSPEDQETLIDQVDVVYHCAANCRFDETLRRAVLLNVRGTLSMIELAKRMRHLLVFFHVSTAYCHPKQRVIEEIAYEPPMDPRKCIAICERTRPEHLSAFTHMILNDIPNPYTFTKGVAEGLVNEEFGRTPVCLLRPSFIIPVWKDPIPGWTDTYNGIIGFLIASGKGVLRVMRANEDHFTDFIPVDVAVSGMLFAFYQYSINDLDLPLEQRRRVCNLTTSSEYKFTWKLIKTIARRVADVAPLNWVVWYPDTDFTTNYYVDRVRSLVQHIVPAIIGDCLLTIFGYPRFLLKVHRRLIKAGDVMRYFGERQWEFRNDWSLSTRDTLNPRERDLYSLYGDGLDVMEYFTSCAMSSRRYMLDEPDDTLETAKRHYKIMYYVNLLVKALCIYYLVVLCWKWSLKIMV